MFVTVVVNYEITVLDVLLHLSHFYTCLKLKMLQDFGKFRYNKDTFLKCKLCVRRQFL